MGTSTSRVSNKSTSSTSSSHHHHFPRNQVYPCSGDESSGPSDLLHYAIRINDEQSLALFGFQISKYTLTWHDVQCIPQITLARCIACGIDVKKLHKMQPDIKAWLAIRKAQLEDCIYMGPWRPNPFEDLHCSIGDLILYRHALSPSLLIESGVTFQIMRERYGLTPELMAFLKYSLDDWIALQMDEAFVRRELIPDADRWRKLFGGTMHEDVLARLTRRQQANSPAANS